MSPRRAPSRSPLAVTFSHRLPSQYQPVSKHLLPVLKKQSFSQYENINCHLENVIAKEIVTGHVLVFRNTIA